MTGLSTAVQTAVFTALDGSAALTSLLAPHNRFARSAIYDRMPQPKDSGDNTLFPLITIGEDTVSDWSTDTASGADASVRVNIWSRAPSFQEAKAISEAVYDALHRQELSPPGHEFIGMDFLQDEMIRDPDGITLHIAADYRMIIDEAGYGE